MSGILELVRSGRRLDHLDITDMHAHVGRYGFSIPDGSARGIVRAMDRSGIARTMAAPMPRYSARDTAVGNREALEAMRAHPGRILGYAFVWPSTPENVDAEVRRHIGDGFRGLKLHNVNEVPYTHPAYEPAFAAADAHRMPVLIHTWGARAEFDQARELAKRYPNMSLLLAHTGSRAEEDYLSLGRECENVYLELALSLSPRGLVERLVAAIDPAKIVWGSDVCFINQAQQLGKVVGARIPDEYKAQILSGNAARILGRFTA